MTLPAREKLPQVIFKESKDVIGTTHIDTEYDRAKSTVQWK